MSTRANVIIQDHWNELIFYRHSDGYPEGVLPTLRLFLDWVKDGKIRDNLSQSAGWLIVIGSLEYDSLDPKWFENQERFELPPSMESVPPRNWKCGAYEPTTGIHGDIEYLYVVDLVNKEIYIDGDGYEYKGKYSVDKASLSVACDWMEEKGYSLEELEKLRTLAAS